MSGTKAYKTWIHIKERCYNRNIERYNNYGGRGIKVCPRWKDDFQAFYDDVSKLPHFEEEGYSLDRIDVNGHYEPGNVRWATTREQLNNTTRNHFVTYNGERNTLAEWSKIVGIPYKTLFKRILDGWDIEKAFTIKENPCHCMITYKGESKTIAQWAREKGIQYHTLKQRLNKYHWSIEKALETP